MSASRLSLPVAVVLCLLTLATVPAAATSAWSAPAGAPHQPVEFSLDRSHVKTGTKVTGIVTTAAEDEERVVRVERAMPEGWVLVRNAALPAAATEVRVPMPTGYYSRYSYRVSTTSKRATVTSLQRLLSVRPSYVPAGRPSHVGTPVGDQRWDPCAGPIRYVVNSAQAWPRALAETRIALRRITQATGLRFVPVGSTRMVPKGRPTQRLPNRADLVIAWVRPNQTPLLTRGTVGQARYFTDAVGRITGAQVAFHRNGHAGLKPGFGAAPRRGTLLMHELSHAVGLGHVNKRSQVMYPNVAAVASKFGAGDLAGLARVGAQRGCQFTA
ncbi:MAG: hypothetical protein Q8O61_19190 [Nocardioides sp.]|nr:hypothetical protein [Nocardioides sp.]